MRKINICFLILFVFSSFAYAKEIKNLDGSLIVVPDKVNKVAALFGPSYERLFVLDVEDKIIVDGDFHLNGWPWSNIIYKRLNEIKGIPNAHNALNLEEVLKMNPDVVFYWDNPQAVKKMKEVGIAAVPAVSTGKLDEIKNTLIVYAGVFGTKEKKIAMEYAAYFDEKVTYVKNIASKIKDKPAVYMANQEILWTFGKSSDMAELISAAGGICVHKDIEGGSKTEIAAEQLIKWNPDYIFVDHAGSSGNAAAEDVVKKASKDERLNDISAFRNNKIYINPTGVFFWDSGVQKILLLLYVAKTIHPDQFRALDMNKELKIFYKKFFRYELTDIETEKILKHQNP